MTIRTRSNEKMIDEDVLDETEAQDFLQYYLIPELKRHYREQRQALANYYYYGAGAARYAWSLSVERHRDDIIFTYKGIRKLADKYGLHLSELGLQDGDIEEMDLQYIGTEE